MAEPWPNLSPSHILQVESGWRYSPQKFRVWYFNPWLSTQVLEFKYHSPPYFICTYLLCIHSTCAYTHTYMYIFTSTQAECAHAHTYTHMDTHTFTHTPTRSGSHTFTLALLSLSLSLQLALIVAQSREPGGHLSGIKLSALSTGLQRVAKVARRRKGEWVCEGRGLLQDSKKFARNVTRTYFKLYTVASC